MSDDWYVLTETGIISGTIGSFSPAQITIGLAAVGESKGKASVIVTQGVVSGRFGYNPSDGSGSATGGLGRSFEVNNGGKLSVYAGLGASDKGIIAEGVLLYQMGPFWSGPNVVKNGVVTSVGGAASVVLVSWDQFKALDNAIMKSTGISAIRERTPTSYEDWMEGFFPGSTNPECFLAGTKIDMWPLADGKEWKKPIETMTPDDVVVSYDDDGNLVPGRVTRTFQNTVKHILDLPVPVLKDVDHKLPENAMLSGQNQMYNLMITPGHVTYSAKVEGEDNPYADSHVPILGILRSDGALMIKDGTLVRASTGCDVGSFLDRKIWAIAGRKNAFGQISVSDKGQIRLGTKFVTDDGQILTVLDMIGQMGAMLNQDGLLVRGPQDKVGTMFHWEHSYKLPKPEEYVLQRSNLTLEEIYDADEWDGVAPDIPAPKPMMVPSTPQERVLQASSKDAMAPNIPTSMFGAPNQPTMSRKQRRAHESKMRKQAKNARAGATVH